MSHPEHYNKHTVYATFVYTSKTVCQLQTCKTMSKCVPELYRKCFIVLMIYRYMCVYLFIICVECSGTVPNTQPVLDIKCVNILCILPTYSLRGPSFSTT